jgi:hypothetical protein
MALHKRCSPEFRMVNANNNAKIANIPRLRHVICAS